MSKKIFAKITGFLLTAVMVLTLIPTTAFAGNRQDKSSNMETIGTLAPINQAYLSYMEEGADGIVPSTLDLSYLADNYASLVDTQGTLPSQYDLRDYGRSPQVVNQGSYGTCWAFAAIGASESPLITQFPEIALSQQHLAYFTYTGNEEEEGWNVDADPYNMGGFAQGAAATMAAWKGPVDYSKVPYDPTVPVSEDLRYEADYHLQDAFYLPGGTYADNSSYDTDMIKTIVMEYGAVCIDYLAQAPDSYNEETAAVYNAEYDYSIMLYYLLDGMIHIPERIFLKDTSRIMMVRGL